MALFRCSSGSSGGGTLTAEFVTNITWQANAAVTIPTSKKAKAVVLKATSATDLFYCIDEGGANPAYRQSGGTASFKFTFSNNAITSDSRWGTSDTYINCVVFYLD